MIFPHSGRQLRPLSGLPRRLHQASTILGTITRLANLEARLRPTGERRVLRTRPRVTLAVSTRQRGVERAEVLDARPMDDIVVRRLNQLLEQGNIFSGRFRGELRHCINAPRCPGNRGYPASLKRRMTQQSHPANEHLSLLAPLHPNLPLRANIFHTPRWFGLRTSMAHQYQSCKRRPTEALGLHGRSTRLAARRVRPPKYIRGAGLLIARAWRDVTPLPH
jgi:hypothetical protein